MSDRGGTRGYGNACAYFGEETAGTEEGDEVPIAEPLCELEAAALGVAATAVVPTRRHVRCTEFIERTHHLFDRLFFEPWSILDRKMMRTEDWRWVLRKAVCDLMLFFLPFACEEAEGHAFS